MNWALCCVLLGVGVVLSHDRVVDEPAELKSEEKASDASLPDHSLSSAEYITLGMPSCDREWLGVDMKKVWEVLEKLASKSPDQLPRFESARSGKVFARMCSPENYAFHRKKSVPLDTRLSDLLEYQSQVGPILMIYFSAMNNKQVAPRDVIEISGAMLYNVAAMLELVDEFVPTISKDDPQYEARMKGLDQMRAGLANMVAGSLTTLTEKPYPAADRVAFIGHLKATLPAILPQLSESSQLETRTRLREMSEDKSLAELQPALNELVESLPSAAK